MVRLLKVTASLLLLSSCASTEPSVAALKAQRASRNMASDYPGSRLTDQTIVFFQKKIAADHLTVKAADGSAEFVFIGNTTGKNSSFCMVSLYSGKEGTQNAVRISASFIKGKGGVPYKPFVGTTLVTGSEAVKSFDSATGLWLRDTFYPVDSAPSNEPQGYQNAIVIREATSDLANIKIGELNYVGIDSTEPKAEGLGCVRLNEDYRDYGKYNSVERRNDWQEKNAVKKSGN